MGELTLLLICRGVAWAPRLSLQLLPPLAIGNSAHRIVSLGELSMYLTSCNIQESGPCTSRAKSAELTLVVEAGGTGELALRMKAWETWPCHLSTVMRQECRGDALPQTLTTPTTVRKSWPWSHENKMAGPALYCLPQSGELTLPLPWAAQQSWPWVWHR